MSTDLVFSVLDYGAVGDGDSDDREAIQSAIDAAASAGGGAVYFPPCSGGYGVDLSLSTDYLTLKSHVSLIGSGYAGRIIILDDILKVASRRLFTTKFVTEIEMETVTISPAVIDVSIINLYVDGRGDGKLASSTLQNAVTAGNVPFTVVSGGGANFPTGSHEVWIEGEPVSIRCSRSSDTFTLASGESFAGAHPAGTPVYEQSTSFLYVGIRFEQPDDETQKHERIRIEGCNFVNFPGAVIHLINVRHFTVSRNQVTRCYRGGIIVWFESSDGVIADNVVESMDDCIALHSNSGSDSNDNVGAKGVQRVNIIGNVVYNRDFTADEHSGEITQGCNNGINVTGVSDCSIVGNIVTGAGEGPGTNKANIQVQKSEGATVFQIKRLLIANNRCLESSHKGISLADPGNAAALAVRGNSINDSVEEAVLITLADASSLSDISIDDNEISDCGGVANASITIDVKDGAASLTTFSVARNRIANSAAQAIAILNNTGDPAAKRVIHGIISGNLIRNPNTGNNVTSDGILINGANCVQIEGNVVRNERTRNEKQRLTVTASSGTFTLQFKTTTTTSALVYNISSAALQTALEGLVTVGSGNITVTGGPGGSSTTPYDIEFVGSLAAADQPTLVATPGSGVATAVATLQHGGPQVRYGMSASNVVSGRFANNLMLLGDFLYGPLLVDSTVVETLGSPRIPSFSANSSTASGTNTTPVVGTLYLVEIFLPETVLLTGVAVLNGSQVLGGCRVAIFNASGSKIGESGSVTIAGANAYQEIPFISVRAVLAGRYFIGVQFSNTGTRFRSIPAGSVRPATTSIAGTYGTINSFTPPTTFTGDVGPVVVTY